MQNTHSQNTDSRTNELNDFKGTTHQFIKIKLNVKLIWKHYLLEIIVCQQQQHNV